MRTPKQLVEQVGERKLRGLTRPDTWHPWVGKVSIGWKDVFVYLPVLSPRVFNVATEISREEAAAYFEAKDRGEV